MLKNQRFSNAKVGAQRSGKSFYAEAFANVYLRRGLGPVFVYNAGTPENFADYTVIRPLEPWEMKTEVFSKDKHGYSLYVAKGKPVTHFKVESGPHYGTTHHFRDFTALFWGGGVKMYMYDPKLNDAVFNCIFNYMASTYIVIDDAGEILRRGVPPRLTTIMNSTTHSGKRCSYEAVAGTGQDVSLIVHGLDEINPRLWRLINSVDLFYTQEPPRPKFTRDKAKETALLLGFEELASGKHLQFTGITYDISGPSITRTIINPAEVAAIKNAK